MCKELNLKLERLNVMSEFNRESEGTDDQSLFLSQIKGKCCNCGMFGRKAAQCTLRRDQEFLVHPLLATIVSSLIIPRLIVYNYSEDTEMVKVIHNPRFVLYGRHN